MNNLFKKIFFIGFLIFFSLQFIFILIINYKNYKDYKNQYDLFIRTQLELASYKLKSNIYNISFIKKENDLKILTLYKNNKEIYMLFELPYLKKFFLEVSLPFKEYNKGLNKIKHRILKEFLFYLIVIIILSVIFSLILLFPIQKAYTINEIFIKDILHDFNTPISAMKINLYLFQKKHSEKFLENISISISNILNLQKNLKIYLLKDKFKSECFLINDLIKERLDFYKKIYPNIKIINHIGNIKIKADQFAFERIIDNILSNAFKYNKKGGLVHISYKKNYIIIKDTGKGINNVSEIFDKFYKEQDRGLGIGLNIVYRLSKLLKLKILIRSKKNKGTVVFMELKNKIC